MAFAGVVMSERQPVKADSPWFRGQEGRPEGGRGLGPRARRDGRGSAAHRGLGARVSGVVPGPTATR